MSASPSHLRKTDSGQAAVPHFHVNEEVCPLCEQPIPHDRYDEIKERIETRERERAAVISARLKEQFEREKAQIIETAQQETQAALDRAAQETAEKIAVARDEGRKVAETAAQEQLAEAARANQEAQATLEARLQEAETAKASAEAQHGVLQTQLEDLRRDSAAALERVKQEATAKEAEIRADATRVAEAAMQGSIAEMVQAKTDAEAKATAAEQQVQTLQENFETQLSERLQEQRDALEQAKTEAINAEKAAMFDEKMKLSNKVEELQRALDKKTAEELGEAAELDLFEALKAEFEGDRIERINKGQPGADILHTVVHNGKECGKIIYDSKNHKAWRNEFVTKLAADQMAAKAEHAILSTRKFPAGSHHLHIQNGVILASPARVIALVQIIRDHLLQTTKLRLSNEERTRKTAELYGFITSERCRNFFARIDAEAEKLLEMQVKERKAHEDHWKREGVMLRSIQKLGAELCREIDTIIGTAECPEVIS